MRERNSIWPLGYFLRFSSAPALFVYGLLLVGSPFTPVTDLLPGVGGEAHAGCGGQYAPDGMGPPTPPDADCDGVWDSSDDCPHLAGSWSNSGCPDDAESCEESAYNWLAYGGTTMGVAFFAGMVDDSVMAPAILGTVGSSAAVFGGVKLLVCKIIY